MLESTALLPVTALRSWMARELEGNPEWEQRKLAEEHAEAEYVESCGVLRRRAEAGEREQPSAKEIREAVTEVVRGLRRFSSSSKARNMS